MEKIKKHPLYIIAMAILVCIGISLLLVNPNSFIKVIYVIVGIFLVLIGFLKIMTNRDNFQMLLFGALNMAEGFLFMFFHNFIVTIIIGLAFIASPIYYIIKSPNHKEALVRSIPSFLIALVLIFSGDFFVNVFVKILGVLTLMLAGYYLIYFIFFLDKEEKIFKRRNVIDISAEVRDDE